jgi:hypothetical protein
VEHTCATARQLFSFDHADVVPAVGEVTRRRQASQPGANHNNRVHLLAPIMIMLLTGWLVKLGEGSTHPYWVVQEADVDH